MRFFSRLTAGLLIATLMASPAVAATAKKAVTTKAGQFISIKDRFEGKAVSCYKSSNGTYQSGYITTSRKKKYWNSIADLIKARKKIKRYAKSIKGLQNKQKALDAACKRQAAKSCTLTITAETIPVLENTEKIFTPSIKNSCSLPVTLEILDSPDRGILTSSGKTASYIPNAHSLENDQAKIRAVTPVEASSGALFTFTLSKRALQFAGDKNSLEPYRSTLTQDEVNSLLRRVGLGGNSTLRSMTNLPQLVDALLDSEDPQEVTDYVTSIDNARVSQLPASGDAAGIRWYKDSIKTIDAQALRYGSPFKTWMGYNFWMNHFATDVYTLSNGGNSEGMLDHINFMRNNGRKNFDTLLRGVISKALLPLNLNGYDNSNATPNQNLPREVLELFTAGSFDPISKERNFNEDDVASATTAFGGYYWASVPIGYKIVTPNTILGTPKILDVSNDDAPTKTYTTPYPECYRRNANRIQVRWGSTDRRGSHAQIFRAPLGSSTFDLIGEVNVWGGSFHDIVPYSGCARTDAGAIAGSAAPSPGVVYQYKVKFIQRHYLTNAIVNTSPDSNIETGYFAASASAPAAPANQTASSNLPDRIRLTWNRVSGATNYRIYRWNYDMAPDDIPLATVNDPITSYDDLSVLPNKRYSYYIRAYNSTNKLLSAHPTRFVEYSETPIVNGIARNTSAPDLGPAMFTFATYTDPNSITVSWNPVPGAAGYRVFSTPAYFWNYKAVADVIGQTSYVDTQPQVGQYMMYLVVPFDSSGQLSSSASNSTQLDTRYLQSYQVRNSSGGLIVDDLVRPKILFLDWLPDSHSNVGGRILGPQGDGDYYSIFGQNVYERISWTPVQKPTKSFLDHLLYNWPATSRNIAAKLFASLVHRDINETLIRQVANKLLADRYNLRDTLRMLLMSSASFAPEANGTCVMSPNEALMNFLRIADLPVTKLNTLWNIHSILEEVGQDVASPPSVFGFKNCGLVRAGIVYDGSEWLTSSQTYIALGNGISTLLQQMVTSPTSTYGEGVSLMGTFIPPNITIDANGVVDLVAAKLGINPSVAERAVLADYLNHAADGTVSTWRRNLASNDQTARLSGLLRLMVMTPAFLNK